MPSYLRLNRRERQIMDIILRRGQAAAAEVLDDLPDPPSYSAVRAKLRVLEEKGYLEHFQEGPRYVYRPAVPREKVERTAINNLLQTFFDNSVEKAVAALLHHGKANLSDGELEKLSRLIEDARDDSISPDSDV